MSIQQSWYSMSPEKKRQAARAVGTSQAYLSQLVHGDRKPSPWMARRIEEALGEPWTVAALRPDLAEIFARNPA